MVICRNKPRVHWGRMVPGEKGVNCSALWGIVERWWNPGGLRE